MVATAKSPYGSDVATGSDGDVDRAMSIAVGTDVVAQSCIRRLIDTLWYDDDYGYPLLDNLLNSNVQSVATIGSSIENELLKDDRLSACTAEVSLSGTTIDISIAVTLADGDTFELIGALSTISPSQLSFQIAA